MKPITCPGCGRNLQVKDDFAGKQVKCPGCAKPIQVPTAPAFASSGGIRPNDDVTLPPRGPVNRAARADQPTVANADSIAGAVPPDHAKEDYDFLAPPQGPDELGRLGHYRVLKILGTGGMGVVFRAEDPRLKRPVALKAMKPALAAGGSAKQRFLREAQAAAAVKHDHIVAIYDVGEDRGVPYLAMEFLEGDSLDGWLKKPGRKASVQQAIRIGREIALGLAAAHGRGMIHRDIKPANVWLEAPRGRVKILDFGLARAANDEANLTHSGAIIGTPAYMAPEQGRGENVDARCDLFSLGCVLYRICTGEPPFKGRDTISTLMAVATENPKPPHELNPEVPRGLSDLVMKLLAKPREERPVSAKAVAAELAALERSTTTPDSPPTVAVKADRRPAKKSMGMVLALGAAAVVLGVVCLGGLTAVLFRGNSAETKPEAKRDLGGEPKPESRPDPALRVPPQKTIANSIGMKLVPIPVGKLVVADGKGPRRELKITQPFYLGAYEVTQAQYFTVTGKSPSAFKDNPNYPVENVVWDEAVDFCKRLSELLEEKNEGRSYRLPSADEWEYACRAGTRTAFSFGDSLSFRQASFNGIEPYGGAEKGPNIGHPVPVGSFAPNDWGLYDMHGNVWEWCQDLGPGGTRVQCGGSWRNAAHELLSSGRVPFAPSTRADTIGLRVVCVTGLPPPERVEKGDPTHESPTAKLRPELNGQLLQLGPTVWWIDGGRKRHVLVEASGGKFFRWAPGPCTQDVVDCIKSGPDVTVDNRIVQEEGNAGVYFLDQGKKRVLASPAMWGKYNLRPEALVGIRPGVLKLIPDGTPLE